MGRATAGPSSLTPSFINENSEAQGGRRPPQATWQVLRVGVVGVWLLTGVSVRAIPCSFGKY